MRGSKILLIILGVLLVIGGFYCIFSPGLTFSVLAPLIGISMVIDGVGSICSWNDNRKAGRSDALELIAAIVSIVLGIVLLCNIFAAFIMDAMIVYFIIAWLIMVGILRIAAAFKIRSAGKELDSHLARRGMKNAQTGKGWGWMLVFGILMILVGIFGLINPLTIALAVGYIIGFSILASGFSLFSVALALE